jgi:prevent-host-death family protein
MIEVSMRELRNNLTKYVRRVENGERLTITRRGKAVATIEPRAGSDEDPDAWLWKAVREGKMSWSGKKFNPKMPTVRMKGDGPTASEMIIEGRG